MFLRTAMHNLLAVKIKKQIGKQWAKKQHFKAYFP